MPLHLPPDVLRELMDRVQHVRGRLLRMERYPLQAQIRLGDHSIRDAGVLLLRELDLERGVLRDLLADPLKPLLHTLAKLLGHLDVPPSDLDPHRRPPSVGLALRGYARGRATASRWDGLASFSAATNTAAGSTATSGRPTNPLGASPSLMVVRPGGRYSARASVSATIRREPASRSAAAQAARVAPVVQTSSTSNGAAGVRPTARTRGGSESLSERLRPT